LPQGPREQWKLVARIVNLWLTLSRPQPICTIEGSQPAVILAPGLECGWLFTMLSIQLLVAVTGASAIECCSNCRSFYLPKKVASTVISAYPLSSPALAMLRLRSIAAGAGTTWPPRKA